MLTADFLLSRRCDRGPDFLFLTLWPNERLVLLSKTFSLFFLSLYERESVKREANLLFSRKSTPSRGKLRNVHLPVNPLLQEKTSLLSPLL